ncbi:1-deoxy-D-xylulose-5-phosphate reductoisomerase [Paenibacillus tarimensis]|uniref:1-deoxy-D-xylulose-5-phosphate reductoisomerase n=1 Tax=Paenibacillus tarimensis TaxID=416012 RepID=UPI001F16984C|nr:1-deoxy-D-xylulose-5-phosphate reductoisomerase [Paenibacillus tarimensis]MCF2942342.1 1-deoxy-D-xylulose-5-phosphate reductoisomerase [Paenibacillus tarimensis]
MKQISILGSTGSIGTQTLDVIANDPEQYEVAGLAAGTNVRLLVEQALRFNPKKVSLATREAAEEARVGLPAEIKVLYGEEGLDEIAADTGAECVVTALVGSQGLRSTLAAINAGARIGLANKETLVTAGHLVMRQAADRGVDILPVDSEHSAIYQCLNGENKADVKKITLTASGGSFRDKSRQELEGVTVEQALRHPNWSMGSKITIDSATMVNKGLEVIEAHWLFGADYEDLDVLLHPESIIHSYVEFVDNSVIAQLGWPDMRIPIQYALSYPNRRPSPTEPLDLTRLGSLNFRKMDFERYPCLRMAFECGRAGQSAPAVYNAANEVAVARFLKGEISFLAIEQVIERVLSRHQVCDLPDLGAIAEVDGWARREAAALNI